MSYFIYLGSRHLFNCRTQLNGAVLSWNDELFSPYYQSVACQNQLDVSFNYGKYVFITCRESFAIFIGQIINDMQYWSSDIFLFYFFFFCNPYHFFHKNRSFQTYDGAKCRIIINVIKSCAGIAGVIFLVISIYLPHLPLLSEQAVPSCIF